MKTFFHYLIAVNIILIPLVIFIHANGVCELFHQMFPQSPVEYCQPFTNPFMNLLYANIGALVLSLLIKANSEIVPSSSGHKKAPASHHKH